MDVYLGRKCQLCISEDLMAEYYTVLNCDKFSKFPDFKAKANSILVDIENNASFFYPKKKVKIIKDASDNMLLELALECKADILISGNTNDLTFTRYKRTKIVTPREYWEYHKP
ncbi:hypothetical protein GCM10023093_22340 [Nemorincola caseinilytica]|uniref:PIN domain-containing protein n=2 Tax=Nemorincola caseinilytica TaxID=2054315 RepID=A0ABP8NKT8_9BACT